MAARSKSGESKKSDSGSKVEGNGGKGGSESGKTAAINAVDLLIEDHNRVRQLFKDFEAAKDGEKQRRVAEVIFLELELHTKVEEEFFYPALRRKATEDEMRKLLDESLEEHHVADTIIEELKAMRTSNPRYEAKMTVLRENIEHHADEEEEDMLPDARRILADEAEEMGAQMQARKEELKPHQRPDM